MRNKSFSKTPRNLSKLTGIPEIFFQPSQSYRAYQVLEGLITEQKQRITELLEQPKYGCDACLLGMVDVVTESGEVKRELCPKCGYLLGMTVDRYLGWDIYDSKTIPLDVGDGEPGDV